MLCLQRPLFLQLDPQLHSKQFANVKKPCCFHYCQHSHSGSASQARAQAETPVGPAPHHSQPCQAPPLWLQRLVSWTAAQEGIYLADSLQTFWRARKGIDLPLLMCCSPVFVGCPTYSCLSEQAPGFLLQQRRPFPSDSSWLLPCYKLPKAAGDKPQSTPPFSLSLPNLPPPPEPDSRNQAEGE